MSEMLSCCGLLCNQCPAYEATQSGDETKKAEVARVWSEQFQAEFTAADINCDGCCSASERLSGYCRVCEIRACARERQLENCAACEDYICEKLEKVVSMEPEARTRLDALR
ncbi:MAG: DUF3795 domain-containing protein [Deltaproteobacteria bacterium]|nr:DUF3795 domain-containing protein [Deltaproteobacteria bacterium]